MTNNQKPQQEELKEDVLDLVDPKVPYSHFIRVLQKYVQEAISSERQRLIEEVRELVDGMRKNTTLSHACLQSWGGCDCNDNKNYNQALDDLLQELNKPKE